jgi:hypothetical protein
MRVIIDHRRFQIVERTNGQRGILHRVCGLLSWNPQDVEHRYCGFCHEFVADVMYL